MEKQTSTVRFLILEPDSTLRAELRKLVLDARLGEAVTVATLKDAIDILDTQVIDIVISSWDLWGHGTSLSLLKLIRGQERFKHIGFVIISEPSRDEPQKVRAARSAHTDGYLLKPVDTEILKNLLLEIAAKIPGRLD